MRLYIVRHADPDYENNTITPAGHAEAEALAPRLAREGIDRIYSSPLGRALHTAEYTAGATGLEVKVEDWAYELHTMRMGDGPCAGSMAWDLHGEIIRDDPYFARLGKWHTMPPLDDPLFHREVLRVRRDSDAFVSRLGYRREGGRYRVVEPHTEKVVVFCHNGLGLTWLAHLLALPLPLVWSGFWLAPTSVSCVLFDQRSEDWATPRALCVGDTSHLHAAGLSVQPHGIKANYE